MSTAQLIKVFSLFLFSFNFTFSVYSQTQTEPLASKLNNTFNYSDNLSDLETIYKNTFLHPDRVLNGKEYKIYFRLSEANPFYNSNEELPADVFIKENIYKQLKIRYDRYKDELVYTVPFYESGTLRMIALNKSEVDSFVIYPDSAGGRLFKKKSFVYDLNQKAEEAYYQSVHEGKISVFIQHDIMQTKNRGVVVYEYRPQKFVFAKGAWYKFNSFRKLMNYTKSNTSIAKKYLRKNKIKFRKISDNQLADFCKYLDSL